MTSWIELAVAGSVSVQGSEPGGREININIT